MNRFITVGGIGIIAAVLAIFFFMLTQVLPLFFGAKVRPLSRIPVPEKTYTQLGMDEWGQRPFLVARDGGLDFFDFGQKPGLMQSLDPYGDKEGLWVSHYDPQSQTLLYWDDQSQLSFATLQYEMDFSDGNRSLSQRVSTSPFYPFFEKEPGRILEAGFGEGENGRLVVARTEEGGQTRLRTLYFEKTEDLLGERTLTPSLREDLSQKIEGIPLRLALNPSGEILLVATGEGKVYYFRTERGAMKLKQIFEPFPHLKNPEISSMDFLLGGISVLIGNPKGQNVLYSLFIPEREKEHRFGKIRDFSDLPGPIRSFSPSARNRAFLVGSGNQVSLRYGTTGKVRWEKEFPDNINLVALNRKYNHLAVLDGKKQLQLFELEDPHPEGGWNAFFGKVWYEGAPKPAYQWQSTGGSDAFEPKLSLIPLIIGTLKGTFYALLFSIPIALLAAVYTSQFLHPNLKKIVKPTMEIMASLPSVILGFLAALWLAPLIEDKVPSLIMVILVIPLGAFLFGWLWESLPQKWRAFIPEGQEWIAFLPLLMAVGYLAWQTGPLLEKWIFVATDPATGEKIHDFRLWWTQMTGEAFEQRNSLVVGFVMGFAVIPIIFTISEDSISAVPPSLRSASLALGASRWQTAFKVVLPAATAGIFSAMMIGFGRAVGETMIVLMATGNTPLMDFNIFTGMRTLSANLAVELPEAPFQGTLYRTLFLGALLLFLMTFSVNSVAEMMRQRIRRKFKAL